MEVTQFTYFQQAGGKVLEVPSVEITYGLERILMALQARQGGCLYTARPPASPLLCDRPIGAALLPLLLSLGTAVRPCGQERRLPALRAALGVCPLGVMQLVLGPCRA